MGRVVKLLNEEGEGRSELAEKKTVPSGSMVVAVVF